MEETYLFSFQIHGVKKTMSGQAPGVETVKNGAKFPPDGTKN